MNNEVVWCWCVPHWYGVCGCKCVDEGMLAHPSPHTEVICSKAACRSAKALALPRTTQWSGGRGYSTSAPWVARKVEACCCCATGTPTSHSCGLELLLLSPSSLQAAGIPGPIVALGDASARAVGKGL